MIIYDDRLMISYDDRDMGPGQDRDMGPDGTGIWGETGTWDETGTGTWDRTRPAHGMGRDWDMGPFSKGYGVRLVLGPRVFGVGHGGRLALSRYWGFPCPKCLCFRGRRSEAVLEDVHTSHAKAWKT